jgi:hypothetical protein
MTTKTTCVFLAIAVAAIAPRVDGHAAQAPQPAAPQNADETRAIEKKMTELASRVAALAARKADASLLADVDIYRKAAEYILRFPEEFATRAFTAHTMSVLDTGLTRAGELEAGAPSWPKRKGHVVRAYVSRVDGSVQPYGLTIPESYDGKRPVRLDIWQHGTDRTLNEVGFIIQQERERPIPLEQDYIQLEPLGRTNVSGSDAALLSESAQSKRYVVLNSGHTFGEADFRGTNAWLYPRLGDYSVLTATGDVALSGFFDESWQLR